MKRFIFFLLFFLGIIFQSFSQITTIEGYAPHYVGKFIYVYGFQDLLSLEEEQLAVTEVKKDSTFSLSFENPKIRKVVIRSDNNFSYIYAEPNKTHKILLPLHDADKPYRPLGNYVTSIFINLDTNDINNRIVKFNDAIDKFYALNLSYFVRNKQVFIDKLAAFKDSIYASTPNDTSFFSKFIFYSFADADLSLYSGERGNRYIFDTYINGRKVLYDDEYYFMVIKKLYSKVFNQLDMDNNNKVYLAILKKSPALIMKALENDYMLAPVYDKTNDKAVIKYSNEELRELIMIRGLSEAYYDKQFPRTNVIEVLDSIVKFPKYRQNGIIAQNIIKRLTWMSEGNASPDFALTTTKGKLITLKSQEGSYVYLHIFKPEYTETDDDIILLKEIQARYGDIVKFISIYPETNQKYSKRTQKAIESIPWNVVKLDARDDFFKKFRVQSYPAYVLIDRTGMVIGAPALTPRPNGQYVTIDRVFYDIRKMDEKLKEREKEREK